MRIIKYSIITILLFVHSILLIQAQNTEGKDFWLTFGRIATLQPNQLNFVDMQIRVVGGSKATEVKIFFTSLGTPPIVHNIIPYEVYTHSLDPAQKAAVYNTVMGKTNNSIHITSSHSVTVYALISITDMTDVTNVLPVNALGTEYYQISYTEGTFSDAYAVVATQNNTILSHNGTPVETLNAGEVYYRPSTDMTGKLVTSTKPVAFFAVHQGGTIPYGVGTATCQLMQQLAPVNTWGKSFFVPVTKMESEIVRIVASKNGTDITQLGGTIRTGIPGAKTYLTGLNAGDFVELDINLANAGCFIEANNPVGICSYMKTSWASGFLSHPSQCWIPGREQTVTNALIAPFTPNNQILLNTYNYALIITPTASIGNTMVSIGGAAPMGVSGDTWIPNAASGMSFYSMPLTNTTESYFFSNPQGLIIFGYGLGSVYTFWSYYYLAYSAMRDLQATFSANNVLH